MRYVHMLVLALMSLAAWGGEVDPKALQSLAVFTVGNFVSVEGSIRFEGDKDATAAIIKREFKLYTKEFAEKHNAEYAKTFKDYTYKPLLEGYRVIVGSFVVERHEAGLVFIGNWDESAMAVFEKAWGVKRITEKK